MEKRRKKNKSYDGIDENEITYQSIRRDCVGEASEGKRKDIKLNYRRK
jgi:hypothetical protein